MCNNFLDIRSYQAIYTAYIFYIEALMRISRYILPTLKEDPSDAAVTSHRLMIRAALIRKESAGMYAYLPLGLRVLQKIINIVREEMNAAGDGAAEATQAAGGET